MEVCANSGLEVWEVLSLVIKAVRAPRILPHYPSTRYVSVLVWRAQASLDAARADLVCSQSSGAVHLCHGDVLKTCHSQPQTALGEMSYKEVAMNTDLVLIPVPQFPTSLASNTNLILCHSAPSLLPVSASNKRFLCGQVQSL